MTQLSLSDINFEVNERLILKDINIDIMERNITTIIGPNGCGKSTLLKSISRLISPSSGEVYIDDIDVRKMKSKDVARKISILSQKNRLQYDTKVSDLVSFSRYPHLKRFQRLSKYDYDMIEWALKETGADKFKHRMMSELSGGQAQRVWISVLLAQGTDTLLLDEPTTYLDIHHQLETLNILKRLNEASSQTIVMVLHDINHAIKYSDNIIVMKDGQIIDHGHPSEVLTNQLLNEVFNINGEIIQDNVTGKPRLTDYDLFCRTIGVD